MGQLPAVALCGETEAHLSLGTTGCRHHVWVSQSWGAAGPTQKDAGTGRGSGQGRGGVKAAVVLFLMISELHCIILESAPKGTG